MSVAKNEEVFEIKGDMDNGMSFGYDLEKTAIGHPSIRYRDRLTQADVYEMDGHLMVVLYCPKCEDALRITTDKKRIRYDRTEDKISIEPLKCTWPECDWKVEIKANHAVDWRGPL